MSRNACLAALLPYLCAPLLLAAPTKHPPATAQITALYNQLPLSFIPNQGQLDPNVRFVLRGQHQSTFLTGSGAVFAFHPPAPPKDLHLKSRDDRHALTAKSPTPAPTNAIYVKLQPIGMQPMPRIDGLEAQRAVNNYFIGNNPASWRTGVPSFSRVRYADVYPGIDLVYYGKNSQLEFDFVVRPRSDAHRVALEVALLDNTNQAKAKQAPLHIDHEGNLILPTSAGELKLHKPTAYQGAGTSRKEVAVSFQLAGAQNVRFKLGPYDHDRPLVIDPVLAYSTLLGGTQGSATGLNVFVNELGDAYVTGYTDASDFPVTSHAVQHTIGGGSDVFISKLTRDGSALVFSTFLGGGGFESGNALALDWRRNIYVTGWTSSGDFPTTPGVFQPHSNGGADAFVTKLSPDGSRLLYSTYLGGSGDELSSFSGLAVDPEGNAYVSGSTASSDFPVTPGAAQPVFGGGQFVGGIQDAFAAKLNPTASKLLYATYIGGSDYDEGTGIAIDSHGSAYISGHTISKDFPTTHGSLNPTNPNGFDAGFVTRLNPAGSAFEYSTYLTGTICSTAFYQYYARLGVTVDPQRQAWVTGYTLCSDFPTTPNALQKTFGGWTDGFLVHLSANGSKLLYGTYLGGSGQNFAEAVALDIWGNAFVEGQTSSWNFPITPEAYQPNLNGYANAFLTKVNACGQALYSTFLGGSIEENQSGGGIAVDLEGNAILAGDTYSPDFPVTPGAFNTAFLGGSDAFVTKFHLGIGPPNRAEQCEGPLWRLFTSPQPFQTEADCKSYVKSQAQLCKE